MLLFFSVTLHNICRTMYKRRIRERIKNKYKVKRILVSVCVCCVRFLLLVKLDFCVKKLQKRDIKRHQERIQKNQEKRMRTVGSLIFEQR